MMKVNSCLVCNINKLDARARTGLLGPGVLRKRARKQKPTKRC
jgi:hypothetical protein